MNVSIKDIAAAAGVSAATVSNVLNNRKNVGEETRERILEICRQMDYQVNHAGRSLKNGESKTILFNFSDFDRQFYLKIIHGISDYVYARQYDLLICTSGSCERFMSKNFADGCIMLDRKCDDNLLIRKAKRGYPIIALDRQIDQPNIKSLLVNNYPPMAELVQRLVDKGYREFAFLGGPDTLDNRERYQAFRDVLAQNGIPFRPERYLSGDFREKSGYNAGRLLLISEQMPQVLVCANDNMAIGAMRAFREAGKSIPEDVAITGFDDTPMAEVLGLTTVAIPNYERGYLAAQYLIGNIEGAQSWEPFKIQARMVWRTTA